MMTIDEAEVVKMVYSRFMGSEVEEWSEIDVALEELSWLKNEELVQEAKIKSFNHSQGTLRCSQDHKIEYCMAPYILESVNAIISLYEKTQKLHPKNAYILTYYLALSELKMIFINETSSAV